MSWFWIALAVIIWIAPGIINWGLSIYNLRKEFGLENEKNDLGDYMALGFSIIMGPISIIMFLMMFAPNIHWKLKFF